MFVQKLIASLTLAGAIAIPLHASNVLALTCTPTVPVTNSPCSGGGLSGTGTVSKNAAGTTWTYSVNMSAGVSMSGRLVANDGTTAIKNTAGFNCPTATDGTPDGVKGPNSSCSTIANDPKRFRILL